MIGEWLLRQIRNAEKRREKNHPQQQIYPDIFSGTPAISVYRISNGFLLSSNSPGRYEHTMVYCKEVGEIGDQIVTLHAREAMGIPGHVNISASGGGGGGGGSTLAAYPITVPKQRI